MLRRYFPVTTTHLRRRLNGWLLRLPGALRWWKAAHAPAVALAAMRSDYHRASLVESELPADPLLQFKGWLDEAIAARLPEPQAMTLATVDANGHPTARTVLLKACDERGLVFFTNYESRKGLQLAANPHAALLFVWLPLERQVEINGRVEKVTRAETTAYFDTRPLASRLGAWASPQSHVLPNAAELEQRVNASITRFRTEPLTAPPFWGGYRVVPTSFEFWQGRPGRLHDRLRYTRKMDGTWMIERLAP